MPTPVTDPRLLALLDEDQPAPTPGARKPVTDPALLAALEPEPRGFASGVARSLQQGAFLGFGDEFNAGVRALKMKVHGVGDFGPEYDKALADEREANAEFAEQNPTIDLAAQFAGGIVPGIVAPGLAGVNYVRRAATAGQAGRRAAAVGAGYGGVAGFGVGQDGIANRLASGAVSAPVGATLGGALGYGGQRLGEALGGMRQARAEVDRPQAGAYNVAAKALRRDRIDPGQLRDDILPPAGRTVSQGMIARIAQLADEGQTQEQIAQQLGVTAQTVGRHLRAFQGRNETPLTITDRAALQRPGSGQNTQWTMRAAAATPGEARQRAAETFTERQLGQAQRVVDAVQRHVGDGDMEGRIAQLQAGLREQERAAYQVAAANEQPFDLAGVLTRWQARVNPGFQRGQVRGRVAEGNTPISRAMNRVISAFYDDVDVPNDMGTSYLRAQYPVRGLERFQRAKEELDYAIEQSFKDGRPTALTRQLRQFKSDVMGEVRRTNPLWARANDQFFDGRAGDRALALGEGLALRMGQASRRALQQYEAMDEAQQELARQGFSRRLQDMILNKTEGVDVTAPLRTHAARRTIRRIIERRGDRPRTAESTREADRLLRTLDEEAAGTRTFRSLQGSQTTPLREAVDDLNAPAYLTSAASFLNPRALGQEVVSQAARRLYERRNNALLEMLSTTDPVRQMHLLDAIGRYSAARGAGGAAVMRGAPAVNAAIAGSTRELVKQEPLRGEVGPRYEGGRPRELPGMMRLGGPGGNAMASAAGAGPGATPQPNRNFMQMVAQNPRGWGAAPPADTPIPRQSNNAMATYRAQMLPYAEYNDGTAGFSYPQIVPDTWNAMQKLGRAAESAFGGQFAPQDVMPTAQDAALLSGFAMTGGMALPRPSGSLGAFGRLKTAEDLATRGKYQNPRKPLDWGGAAKLSQARRAELRGVSADDIWEQHGWARQGEPGSPTFNAEAAERYGIKPGEWYTEYGSSPAMLGERYDLGIGQRKRVPPWLNDAPETAFEAEAVYEAPRFPTDEPAPRTRPAAAYEGGQGVATPANRLTTNIRALEDQMRASGKTNAEIAAALERRFLQRVAPEDLASGRVWWRMTEQTGRETGRGERGRFLPARDRLTPEARTALQSDEFAAMTNEGAAKALKDRFGLQFSREAIVDLRHELGVPASARIALSPEAEKLLSSSKSNGEVARLLREQHGIELTPNAVRHRRGQRGVGPEQRHGFAPMQLPPEAERALRSARYQKMGKRTAARALKEDFGIDISHETLRKIRIRMGL